MSNRILSYRGVLADGAQETILLSTKKGEVGYKITKFQLFPGAPGVTGQQSIVKIYKDLQSTIDGDVNFSDNRLLAAGYFAQLISSAETTAEIAVFDNEIFNQDIFMTYRDVSTSNDAMNYYLELETISLDESQAMVATLKDIRNNS